MIAASQGSSGDPAMRNLVTTWEKISVKKIFLKNIRTCSTWTCMKSTANTVIAVAWTTNTKHSLKRKICTVV